MHNRHLFLVGYDISQNARRRLALRGVKGHALGGQKSFYECWLSASELQQLMAQLAACIDPATDRVVLIQLDGRSASIGLGTAEPIARDDYFYIA